MIYKREPKQHPPAPEPDLPRATTDDPAIPGMPTSVAIGFIPKIYLGYIKRVYFYAQISKEFHGVLYGRKRMLGVVACGR